MTVDSGQKVLITGASRGIGKACAIALAQAGYSLAIVSRNQAELDTVAQEIKDFGGQAFPYAMDLTDTAKVASHLQHILAQVGPIDILINNAGMAYTGTLGEMSLDLWQRIMTLNLTSAFQCIQAVLPGMRQQKSGTIVNVISVAGKQAFPEWGAYCASKFGLMGLTKSLAQEERSHGIRVVAFCPGSVNTPLWDTDTVQADFDRSAMLSPEDVAQTLVQTVSLPSHAVIEEILLMPNAGTF